MPSYLCDICHKRYYLAKLAKECESQGIPNMSKVKLVKGTELPPVDFLCKQRDFTKYLK